MLDLRKECKERFNFPTLFLAEMLHKSLIYLPDTGFKYMNYETGFQSQSLKAAYFLKKAGYRNVKHLRGGIAEYRRTVGPLVPGDSTADAESPAQQKSLLPW